MSVTLQELLTPQPTPPAFAIALGLALCDALQERGTPHLQLDPRAIEVVGAPPSLAIFDPTHPLRLRLRDPDPNSDSAYRAPEQWDARPTGPRSDVFAVGAILARLLTGHAPPTRTPIRVDLPYVPAALARTIHWALHRQPAGRCPDVETLARALREAGGVTRPPLGAAPFLIAGGLLLALGLALVLILGVAAASANFATPNAAHVVESTGR